MNFRSLRFKLTVWYVFILGVLLIAFSTFLYLTLEKSLYRSADNKLRSFADLIGSESASPLSKFSLGSIDKTLEATLNLKPVGKFIQVLDESGKIGPRSDNLRNVQLPISLTALKNAAKGQPTFETNRSFEGGPLRILTFPVMEDDRVARIVQVASSLEDVEDALNKLFIILVVSVPLALLVASVGGQFLASKALRPVDEISQTARMITFENLNQRIRVPKVRDELSRLIETLNEMISRLDRSFQQTKQFTSDASHELKTPLTILKGEVEVALRKERTPLEYEQTLKSNLEEIDRMSQIVNDLLLLSKADSGELRLTKQEINLGEVLSNVIGQLSRLAQVKNLHLETSNHQDGIYVFGDVLRIRELFVNLIENGIKYTEPGGFVRVTLSEEKGPHGESPSTVAQDSPSGFATIVVADSGIGIAKEDQERIFDRFFRVDKARSREQGGSGLGLSICRWIVEAHQGEIWVESTPGTGSSFTVRLPLSPH